MSNAQSINLADEALHNRKAVLLMRHQCMQHDCRELPPKTFCKDCRGKKHHLITKTDCWISRGAHHFAQGEEGDEAACQDEGGEDPRGGKVVRDYGRHRINDHRGAVLACAVRQAFCSARHQCHTHRCQACGAHTHTAFVASPCVDATLTAA